MASAMCEAAVADANSHGKAVLKFISANDVGLTGGHQAGYYLPRVRGSWKLFTTMPPERGTNTEHPVKVLWQDGRETDSRVKWYGKGTRSEYRLTRFGRDFPFLMEECVGDLLVLVPASMEEFHAYVLDLPEDIDEVQAALGTEVIGRVGIYLADAATEQALLEQPEGEDLCLERKFRTFVEGLRDWITTAELSDAARATALECIERLARATADQKLLVFLTVEFRLFKLTERKLCAEDICRVFEDVDDFVETANSILNRRKARAGKSLEHHVDYLLSEAGIPHAVQPRGIKGKPDIVIPSEADYNNEQYPADKLIVLGVKRTCKDRWRQVLKEAPRVERKHILTIQAGISPAQLREMRDSGVSLIVPRELHSQYPRDTGIQLLTLEEFITEARTRLS